MYKNKLEVFLGKKSEDFTKTDLIKYFKDNDMKMLSFRYIAGDGRLKTLSFVISSEAQLDQILSSGERADGSSLFNYIEAGSSDLYVVPQYCYAFEDPFEDEPTLSIICQYYSNDGKPLQSSPYVTLMKAAQLLEKETGMTLEAMGELEFYIIAERQDLYPANDQRAYHESPPFTKFDFIYKEALKIIAEFGGVIKYGHSEVGNFKHGNQEMEQYEIEFQTTRMDKAAISLIYAKWVLRMLGAKYGVTVSFAPKITVGKAGSGMHIHMRLMKDGVNMMVENGILSNTAKKMIAGLMTLAPALTAFGNTIPTSYLRLVPHQEAPTNVCWGDRNRSGLVRVPLGWLGDANNMISDLNPLEQIFSDRDFSYKQTIEFRCPDGSADIFLLLAGLTVATHYGLNLENAVKIADRHYVGVNIFDEKNKKLCKKLRQLPASCFESADALLEFSDVFTQNEVFSKGQIEAFANFLKSYKDKGLSEALYGKNSEISELVSKYLHFA